MSPSKVFPPPSQTRLVTIVAHVDHGKTTLADNLIESNGIISERLAGTLRYLDSMEEEQRRGITMRTSAIGLRHTHRTRRSEEELVIHLLDSPGHTDFAPEVSSSLQLCDGAILVVDAIEGMCARTHQVLREAYSHQLVPLLVINKIDRICTELCLSPTEAYVRLRHLIESINAASSAMITAAAGEDTTDRDDNEEEEVRWTFEPMKGNVIFASALYGWGFTVPSLARSLFRSKKIPIKPPILRQFLFGDYKYNEEKVLKWKLGSDAEPLFAEYALQPLWDMYEGVASAAASVGISSGLFADGRAGISAPNSQLTQSDKGDAKIKSDFPGMDKVFSAMSAGGDTSDCVPSSLDGIQKILNQTGASTEESVLRSLLRRYRPLSDAVLNAVSEHCPNPIDAASKVRTLALALKSPKEDSEEFLSIQRSVSKCDVKVDSPTVAHVCKFMTTDRAHVTDPDLPNISEDDDTRSNFILGLARVLSGTLRADGSEYFLFGPKYEPRDDEVPPRRCVRLYLLMGSSFVRVNEVPAGHLCAVYNLEDLQLKTVTMCSDINCMPLQGFDRGIRPLVKVHVEPVSAADTDALERGLMKLSQADAAVEVTATSKGECILACLGELHLQQSILDLETVYCGKDMKLRISDPIVEFAETTKWFDNEGDYEAFWCSSSAPLRQVRIPPYCEEEGIEFAKLGRTRAILSGRGAAISLRVTPLSNAVFASLQRKKVVEGSENELLYIGRSLKCGVDNPREILSQLLDTLCALDGNGNALIEAKGITDGCYVKAVISELGDVYVPGVPLEEVGTENSSRSTAHSGLEAYSVLRQRVRQGGLSGDIVTTDVNEIDASALAIWRKEMRGSVAAGFQLAMRYGPVCEEPVRGVMVVLESVEIAIKTNAEHDEGAREQTFCSAKPLNGGMVVSGLRSGIRCSLLTRPVRLMERVFLLTLHSSLAGLGSLYGVLSKRRGKVLSDSMVEGTDLLLISATLPQAESFGLQPELVAKSSGEVTVPTLVFSHWELLDEDPFWIPTSLEEREDFGEIILNGDSSTGLDNTALKYIRIVRGRKGLLVDSSQTVVAAEKQRTLKR